MSQILLDSFLVIASVAILAVVCVFVYKLFKYFGSCQKHEK